MHKVKKPGDIIHVSLLFFIKKEALDQTEATEESMFAGSGNVAVQQPMFL